MLWRIISLDGAGNRRGSRRGDRRIGENCCTAPLLYAVCNMPVGISFLYTQLAAKLLLPFFFLFFIFLYSHFLWKFSFIIFKFRAACCTRHGQWKNRRQAELNSLPHRQLEKKTAKTNRLKVSQREKTRDEKRSFRVRSDLNWLNSKLS
jgi:hypothetical protein